MRSFWIFLAFYLFCAGGFGIVRAQAPSVVSTWPSDGEAGIPQDAIVTVTFDQPIDESAALPLIGYFGGPAFRSPRPPQPDSFSVALSMGHYYGSDYAMLIGGMYPVSECEMALIEPTLVRYTTADAMGTKTVSGHIPDPTSAKRSPGSNRLPFYLPTRMHAERPGTSDSHKAMVMPDGGITYASAFPSTLGGSAGRGQLRSDEFSGIVIVYRVEETTKSDGDVHRRETFEGVALAPLSGAFEVPYLEEGTYTVHVILNMFGDEPTPRIFGIYDPDGDGHSDDFEIGSTGASDIDVSLFEQTDRFYTMEGRLEEARALAVKELRDEGGTEPETPYLASVRGGWIEDGGLSQWHYTFYSPEFDTAVEVFPQGIWDAKLGVRSTHALGAQPQAIPAHAPETQALIEDAMADPDVQTFFSSYDHPGLDWMQAGSADTYFGYRSLFGRSVWLMQFTGTFRDAGKPLACGGREDLWTYLTMYKNVETGETVATIPYQPVLESTARAHEPLARATVEPLVVDPSEVELYRIESENIGSAETILDGKTERWIFDYRTPSLGCTEVFLPTGTTRPAQTCPNDADRPIPAEFVDSDVALALAVDEGAADIVDRYENVDIDVAGGTSSWLTNDDASYDGRPVWEVYVRTINRGSGEKAEELRVYVDMATGDRVAVERRVFHVDSEEPHEMPESPTLAQSYPNPFQSKTTISFVLPRAAKVRLAVYDVLGREIAVLADGNFPEGRVEMDWNAQGIPSGVYLYRLESLGRALSGKLILQR